MNELNRNAVLGMNEYGAFSPFQIATAFVT